MMVLRVALVIISLFVTLVSVDQLHAQSDSSRAITLLNTAVDAHVQDWEWLKMSSGHGQISWIGPDGESTWVCDARFEISETKLWEQLVTLRASPATSRKFDKIELVADGDVIAAVSYSDRIKPSGCKVEVRADEYNIFYTATSGSRIDLRKVLSPDFLRVNPISRDIEAGATISLEENSTPGTETVVVKFPDSHRRYVLSSDWGWRLVKMELFAGKAEPSWIIDYTWLRKGEKVFPESITVQLYNVWSDEAGYHTHVVSFDKLVKGSTRRSFSIESMDACGGARLIDHRPSTTTPVP